MTSLADELFAASSHEEQEGTNVSNHISQTAEQYPENNPNIANTTSPRTNVPTNLSSPYLRDLNKYELNNDQCLLPTDTSYDMDITCDVTLSAMSTAPCTVNYGININNTVSGTNMMDETVGANARQKGMMDDSTRCDLSTTKIEDKQPHNGLDISSDNGQNVNVTDEIQQEDYKMGGQSSCLWSHISTDFDPDEETANFGTRHALEADGKLFDVFTYATIEPKGEVERDPNVISSSVSNRLALILDSCLHVFNHDVGGNNSENEVISIDVNVKIDAIAWSPCRNFVLLALSSGHGQLVHLPSRVPLPPVPILEDLIEDWAETPSFASCWIDETGKDEKQYSLLLLSSHGKLHRLNNVDLEGLHHGLCSGDFVSLKKLQNQIKKDVVFEIMDSTASCTANMYFSEKEIQTGKNASVNPRNFLQTATLHYDRCNETSLIIGTANQHIGKIGIFDQLEYTNLVPEMLELGNHETDSKNNAICQIVAPVNSPSSDILFVVDTSGSLHIVCPYTMLEFFVWNEEKVLEIVLLEDEGDTQLKILMVTKRPNKSNCMEMDINLQIREYPSFRLVYELKVNSFCKPLHCSINQESPMILEGSFLNPDKYDPVLATTMTSLRIRGICEGNPEIRLSRLLRRNKFEEAEICARINRLDFEKIHQAKSSWLLGKLSPWNLQDNNDDAHELNKSYLKELKETLKTMRNLDYMVRCCVAAALPSLKDTRDILLLARSVIQKHINSDDFDQSLLSSVSYTLQRLETFIYTYQIISSSGSTNPPHTKNTMSSIELIEKWSSFNRADMLITVEQFLSQGEIDAAILVWQRHQAEFSNRLTPERIGLLLNLIKPDETKWSGCDKNREKMFAWLSQFIPDCLRMEPECLPVLADWTTVVTKRLELRDRKNWPSNGLKLALSALEAMHFCNRNMEGSSHLNGIKATRMPLTLHQQRIDHTSNIYKLTNLIEGLYDLKVLHGELKIRIRLDDFMQEDKIEVCTQLLDWCSTSQEVNVLLEKFLLSFLIRFNLKKTKILADYCEKLISDTGFCWYWELGSTAPWEEKVSTIVDYLSECPKTKSEVILDALKYAPVPWSNTIKNLCEDGYHLPQSTLIREQEKLVDLKQILRKYNCRSLSVGGRGADAILRKVIKMGGSYEEIVTIANLLHGLDENSAKKFYIQHVLEADRTNDQHNEALKIMFDFNYSTCFNDIMEIAEKILIRAKLLFKFDFEDHFLNSKLLKIQSENLYNAPYLLFLKALASAMKTKYNGYDNQEHIEEFELKVNRFSNMCELRSKFDINLTDGCSAHEIEGIINAKITDLVSKTFNCEKIEDICLIYKKLQQLVFLIRPLHTEITHEKVICILVAALAKEKKYAMAVEATKLLTGSNDNSPNEMCNTVTSQTANTFIDLILHVNSDIEDANEPAGGTSNEQYKFPRNMAYLASQAVNNCDEVNLIDNVFISRWQTLISEISQQFHNRNIFEKFQDGARSDGSNIVYDIWKFSPIFVDKALPLPDSTSLIAPAKFVTMLVSRKTPSAPYLPSTIIYSRCRDNHITDGFETQAKTKLLSPSDILESTLAVCALSPPPTISPMHSGINNSPNYSHEREDKFKYLSNKMMQHCHHYLNPMNQTVLTLESLILAENTLMSLIVSCSNPASVNGLMSTLSKFRDMAFQETQKLLPKVLSDKKPDLLFGLSLLLVDNNDKRRVLKILKQINSSFGYDDVDKIGVLGRIGMRYCAMSSLLQQYLPFKKLLVQSVWAKKSTSLGGSNKSIFTIDTEEDKMKVLQALVENNDMKLKTLTVCDILQFSKAFDLEKASVLFLFIRSTLISSKVEPQIALNKSSQEEITFNFSDEVAEQVSEALLSVPDNEKNDGKLGLISQLFFYEVSPYNYEVLQYLLQKWKCMLERGIYMNQIKEEYVTMQEVEESDETLTQNNEIEDKLQAIVRFEKMLEFLQSYQRTEEPTSEEIDRWHEIRSGSSLPDIAKQRLPFHQLSGKSPKDTFKFLMEEFQLKNLDQWLKSANEAKFIFRLSPSNICVQAVQNAVKHLTENTNVGNVKVKKMPLQVVNWSETLKEVEKCIHQISELYKATTLTHWIINRLPDHKGDERLFCARMCRKFAEGWKQQAGENDQATQKGFNFAVTTQVRLEIEQILRRNNLLDSSKQQLLQEFQQLEASKIVQLIVKLYEHPSIIERAKNVGNLASTNVHATETVNHMKVYPDINGAVKEIANMVNQEQQIFEINLDVIKYELLDALLKEKFEANSSKNNFDDTMTTFSLNILAGKDNFQDGNSNACDEGHSNYTRCVYLLQGFEHREGIDYLLQIALHAGSKVEGDGDADLTSTRIGVTSSNVSTMQKLRSLKCLLSVVRQDELDKIGCGIFEEEHFIEKRFHNFGFVSRLEKLNLPGHDLISFEQCDKTALIEGILRICSYSAEGISIMVDLCLAYDVFKPSLWTGLLGKMISQGLWKEMRSVLLELNGRPAMWNLPIFLEAWNRLLSEPFTRASIPVTSDQRKGCLNSLELIKCCPVAADLDLKTLSGECKRLGLEDMARELLLPLITITDLPENL